MRVLKMKPYQIVFFLSLSLFLIPALVYSQSVEELRAQHQALLNQIEQFKVESQQALDQLESNFNDQIQEQNNIKSNLQAQESALRNQEASLQNDLNITRETLNVKKDINNQYSTSLRCSGEGACKEKAELQDQIWGVFQRVCGMSRQELVERNNWKHQYTSVTGEYEALMNDLNLIFDLFSWQIPSQFKIFRSGDPTNTPLDAVLFETQTLFATRHVSSASLTEAFFKEMIYHRFGRTDALPALDFNKRRVTPTPMYSICVMDGTYPPRDESQYNFEISLSSQLDDFSLDAQSAIVAQLWLLQHDQGISPHFLNSSEYQLLEREELVQLFRDVVHSTVYLKNRTLNGDRTYHATQSILLRPVTVPVSSSIRLQAGREIVFSPGTRIVEGSQFKAKADSNTRFKQEQF